MAITTHEASEIEQANATGRTPVVFIHGLWLLPSSWDRWAAVFDEAGYAPLTPGWPDDPDTVEEANAHPEVFAGKTVGQVADHFSEVIGDAGPHSRRSSATPSAACSPRSSPAGACRRRRSRSTRHRSVACCRCRSRRCKSAFPVLGNPANRHRAVPLTYDQFRYAFANAVDRGRGQRALRRPTPCRRPARRCSRPRRPTSTRGPRRRSTPTTRSAAAADHLRREGPHRAVGHRQRRPTSSRSDNPGVTEIVEIPGRGHALTIDSGWREVADTALAFVQRFV